VDRVDDQEIAGARRHHHCPREFALAEPPDMHSDQQVPAGRRIQSGTSVGECQGVSRCAEQGRYGGCSLVRTRKGCRDQGWGKGDDGSGQHAQRGTKPTTTNRRRSSRVPVALATAPAPTYRGCPEYTEMSGRRDVSGPGRLGHPQPDRKQCGLSALSRVRQGQAVGQLRNAAGTPVGGVWIRN
jgi:hypothetical protein